jgi:hypothetical protein
MNENFHSIKRPFSGLIVHKYPAFDRLPDLAARLGVKPCMREAEKLLLETPDGLLYDYFELINKFLDRMDACIPRIEE